MYLLMDAFWSYVEISPKPEKEIFMCNLKHNPTTEDPLAWFNDTLENFKDDSLFQAEVIMFLNEWDAEPILRNDYDGD